MNSTSPDKACLGCGRKSPEVFLDLGRQPLANSFLTSEELKKKEPRYRLAAAYCPECHLVQLTDIVPPEEMFSEYLYFSSYSESFLEHASEMAGSLTKKFGLDGKSFVLEIASNDGYLLKNFVKAGIPVLGVEPARNICEAAQGNGVPTLCDFFNKETAGRILKGYGPADVVIGNNVLAHVPLINDFLSAVKLCIKDRGAAVFEVPWLRELLRKVEFDTVYHEHVFYYSLSSLMGLFERAGLAVFDVEVQPVHGGSLRVFVCGSGTVHASPNVKEMLDEERTAGLTGIEVYRTLSRKVEELRGELLRMLGGLRARGKKIAAYGAAAKGSVLLNYCGIGPELIEFVSDRNTYKQRRFMPGVHIPIYAPERVMEAKPDYLLILPWNLKEEIMSQMSYIRQWGGKFITAVPKIEVL